MQATLQRVRALECQLQSDPEYLADQRELQRAIEYRQELLEFIRLFPRGCRKAVLIQLDNNEALDHLFWCMQSRRWPQVPIPLEVAQIYLADEKATPYQRCVECSLLLPLRWGIWRNTITKSWWQAPLRYFASCPACGGAIGSRHEGKPYHYPYVPLRVEPPWEFLEESTHATELNQL